MGGVVIFILWIISLGVLWRSGVLPPSAGAIALSGGLFFGLGAIDDLISVARRRSLGLSIRWKMGLSTLFVVALWFAFRDVLAGPQTIPFAGASVVLPSVASLALTWFAVLGTAHGLNLADGLDGLAAGLAILMLLGILALRPTAANVALILPLVGSTAGFLWVNAHPAKLFLGDAGSYFLGGLVATVALANGLAFVLPILAGVLVAEALSVIVQVVSRRLFGRRVFRMSPLHHHFEKGTGVTASHIVPAPDWEETQITTRLWIIQALFVGLAAWAIYV